MLIKLLAQQVPQHWELIKYAVIKVDEVDDKNIPGHLNSLLFDLLNDKAQCFLRLDDKRAVTAVFITEIQRDKVTGEGRLYIRCLFSFAKVDDKEWEYTVKTLWEFSKSENLDCIKFDSRNPRVWELGIQTGFKEESRRFTYKGVE